MATYKLVGPSEIPRAYELESEGYDPSEAATLEKLEYRQRVAPELFLGSYLDDQLIGYVVSTLTTKTHLTHESMSEHHPSGKTVCVHSVCVDKRFLRKGYATQLVKEYIKRLQEANQRAEEKKFDRIVLIAHDYLIPLYEKCGFILVGESEVIHGPEKWYELQIPL
ncbi:acyl-CoA N-acyltransferase [Basidiobolus meristosporus CBS 931.73]|uniref:Acyl-CoA N-acyltransferase n=1 Tax=Basidiobolus meristosporus CBS 931.73 TaxID=1314790 RepID=A0A1Y1YNZ2_9FUNG|nr:acyl-CoA N-acyltransferase [Basidiobolus meristosporus CBS 931.73]|eukprot:ORX99722.1 acyl-CoA N-acyltransferase [Basidiobolus meristosporus CBS 931.73]